MLSNRPKVSRAPSMKRVGTAVDPRCVEWCRSKVKLLGDDVDALWRPEVRGHPEIDRDAVRSENSHPLSDAMRGVSR